jgi:hypothetical protein
LLAATLGLSLVALALYAIDCLWAPFCLEMTYVALTCWVLWPLLVLVDLVGLLVKLALRLFGGSG